jgi:raffinose/stachyose/melibiose transport system permease protein
VRLALSQHPGRPLRSATAVAVFLLPALVFYLAAVAYPIAQSLWLSLFEWDGIGDMRWIGLGNYTRMLTADDTFRWSLLRSLVFVTINLFFQLLIALFLANLLTYAGRGREAIKTMYFLPTIISTMAISFLFANIYSFEPEGMLNLVLGTVGLDGFALPWLSDVRTALVAVSIPEGWRMMGLYLVILYAALLAVPKEVEEAARLDGANELRVFRHVRFPYIRPVWVTTMVMATTYSLRGFDIPYLLTFGGPGQSSELLTTYMYKKAFTSLEFGYASAIAVAIVAQAVVAVVLIIRLVGRREA